MKAVNGFTKEQYKNEVLAGGYIREFDTVKEAAEYLAKKYDQTTEKMTENIMNDTNSDAIYFDDGSTLLCELGN